jgi:uncharacterized repeat protein (TIGR01451 family)
MQWNGPNGFVSAATNLDHLFAGSYSLQYTDSRGCGGTQYFNVDSLGSLSISYLPHIVTCRGASNGAIQFKSLRPYSALANYAWNGGANFSANTQSIYGLSPGEYTVTVSENYGCKTSKTFTIAESFDVGVAAIKNINCPAPGMQIIVHPLAGDLAQLQGNHCATAISGQVKMIVNGAAHYSGTVQGALIPTVNGDTLVWDVSDYGTLRIDSSFFVKLDVDTTAALGSQICITMEVTPEQGDYNPSNNKASYCMTVIRAYDPNEKQVFPEGDILATQESFVYTVHFQNVGTGAAHTVYVLDTLDQQFDPKSFSVLASSFPAQTTLKGDAIRFQFNNIDLTPASQNWQASEGWIQYAVKPKHALVLGTAIQNTAHIYFDYNTPITTNTTVNRVVEHQGESTGIMNNEQELLFYPNPVKNYLYLHLNSNIAVNTAQVLDVEGRLITSKLLVGQHHSIPMDNLAEGVYWLRLTLKTGGSIVKKFIKE